MKAIKISRVVVTLMLTAMIAVTLAGCTKSSEDEEAISEAKTSTEEVKQETEDLIQALGDYTADQRDEAVERTKTAIDKLDERIDALEARIDDDWDQLSEAARERARANLEAMRKQRDKVSEWHERLKTSSAEAWENIKKGFSDAYKNLSDVWEKSEEEFDTDK